MLVLMVLLGDMICCCSIAVHAMYSLVCLAARLIREGSLSSSWVCASVRMQVDMSCCWCCRMILCCSSFVVSVCARGRDGCVLFLFDDGEDLLADGDDPILAR